MQVYPSGNYIPMVISPPNYTSLSSIVAIFLAICLMAVLYHQDIPSFMAEILLFDSVFHVRVTPISVSILKPPLGVNKSYTTETLNISYSKNSYIRLVVTL